MKKIQIAIVLAALVALKSLGPRTGFLDGDTGRPRAFPACSPPAA